MSRRRMPTTDKPAPPKDATQRVIERTPTSFISRRTLWLGFAAFQALAAVTVYQRTRAPTSRSLFGVPKLPEAYAICPDDPHSIYTVDPDAPTADCLLVRRDIITAVGSMGTRRAVYSSPAYHALRSCQAGVGRVPE